MKKLKSALVIISIFFSLATWADSSTHRTFQFNCRKDSSETFQASYTLDVSYQEIPPYNGQALLAFGRIKNVETLIVAPDFQSSTAGPSIKKMDAKGTVQCPAGYVEGGCLAQFTDLENPEIQEIQVTWHQWDEISAMLSLGDGNSYLSVCRVLSDKYTGMN